MQRVSLGQCTKPRARSATLGLLGLLMTAGGCAPSTPPRTPDAAPVPNETALPAESEPAAEGTPPEPTAPPSAASPSADDGLDADIAELSASTRAGEAAMPAEPKPAASAPAGDDLSGRNVVYRVTPKGLVIEIDGFHLRPEAKPFKDENGAYGVELSVHAESFDGRSFWVDTPKEGPLSIAGKVQGKDGKVQRFADDRVGSGEEVVSSEAPRTFKQRWPGHGQPKLWAGQTLTLEVGLWGVRAESERERPVRRLFTVKLVGGHRSPAVIEPPAMDWGS